MSDIKIEIKNLPQIKAAFGKSPIHMAKELNIAIHRSIIAVERHSKVLTPVDTGLLRASHVSYFGHLHGETGPVVEYAFYVHDGTRYMRARPFLHRALESEEPVIDKNFEVAVQNVLDKIGRSV